MMKIFQTQINVKAKNRGFHLITQDIEKQIPDLKRISNGIVHLHIKHTSAALTINENADTTVRADFETFFNRLVPETPSLYQHLNEGLDDMTSHIKSSILGPSISIPITNGQFNLGTWQGIYLCEFRNVPRTRTIVVTIIGDEVD